MKSFLFSIIFTLLCAGFSASAAENSEIGYLLSYLENSGCSFVRNGNEYQAKKAREHLEMKYDYAKKRIGTAEDFINKIASRSSMTRKPYQVRCAEVETPAKQWLTAALITHRQAVKLDKNAE